MEIPDYQSIMLPLLKLLSKGAFQKRGSRSKKQQWQRINEEGVSLRGAQATKQSRSKRLLRSARNDTFSSLGCPHHLGEYLFSGMHPLFLSGLELEADAVDEDAKRKKQPDGAGHVSEAEWVEEQHE